MYPLMHAALLGAQPDEPVTRINFETLTPTAAESLNGKAVVATVTVDKPAYARVAGEDLRTVFGPRFTAGGDRTVVLKGNRLYDTNRGAKVTVVGTLRVIRHRPSTICSQNFVGFTEIRIEERDMMTAITVLVAVATPDQPGDITALVSFDTLTLKDAERLDGASVAIRFNVATLATTHGEGAALRTIVGPADRNDGASWMRVTDGQPAEHCRRGGETHRDGPAAGDPAPGRGHRWRAGRGVDRSAGDEVVSANTPASETKGQRQLRSDLQCICTEFKPALPSRG